MNYLVCLTIVLCAKNISGEMYLAGGFTTYLLAASAQRDGLYTVHYPSLGLSESRRLTSYYTDTFSVSNKMMPTTGVEDKSVLVNVSDGEISIQGESDYNVFNILPVQDLGTRHVVASCHSPGGASVVVVATHQYKTSIQIKFQMKGTVSYMDKVYSSGDTLKVDLARYQTFTMSVLADISGTLVTSTEIVGVFVGSKDDKSTKVFGYHQIPPIKLHGRYYMVATSNNAPRYYLQIATDHRDTTLTFSNKTSENIGVGGVFKTSLGPNENILFTTNKPVMTTMCLNDKSSVMVPPVSLFRTQHILFYPGDEVKILTVKDNKDLSLAQGSVFNVPVVWKEIPDTEYKIGTCKIPESPYSSTVIMSSSSFGVLGFDGNYLFSGQGLKAGVATSSTTIFYSDTITCSSDRTTIIVGVSCGLVVLILVVGNVIFACHVYQRKRGIWRRLRQHTNDAETDNTALADMVTIPDGSTCFSNPLHPDGVPNNSDVTNQNH